MQKTLLGIVLAMSASSALACSAKEQLNIMFISEKGDNVSHVGYVDLGKALFSNKTIANELHAYNVTINHKIGEIVLDIESQKMPVQKMLEEVKPLLKAHGFKVLRVSFETPIEREASGEKEVK